MITTKTRLSALALAAATFTTITLAAGGIASAKILRPLPGHGPVTSIDGKPVGGRVGSEAPRTSFRRPACTAIPAALEGWCPATPSPAAP